MQTENTYVETDLGNIALNPRGEYSDEASYEYLDTVSYKGGSYTCLAELTKTISRIAPAQGKNTEHWQMLTLPGQLTPEAVAMHDDVVNKAKQVETSRAAVELSQQEIEAAQADVTQMRKDTQEASQTAIVSRDSAAGYAQSAEASRTAAKESEDNVNALATTFDSHVNEKISEAEKEINNTKQNAVDAVSESLNAAVTKIENETNKQVKSVENAGASQVSAVNKAGKSRVDEISTAGSTVIGAVEIQQEKSVQAVIDEGTKQIKAVSDKATEQIGAVNTTGSTQVSTIETKGADQVKAIQEAGENALQNISDGVDKGLSEEGKAADAKATGEAISKLTEDLSNKITKFYASNQGETHITDSDNGKIQDMMLYGKSEQKQYSGKNLANGQNSGYWINSTASQAGVRANDTGMIINVSNMQYVTVSTRSTQERYRAACVNTIPTGVTDCYNGKTNDRANTPFTIDTTDYNYLIVNATKLEDIQVEKGSEATSFEPYTGGQPSPSLDYPQEIKSVVNPTVKVSNEDGTKSQTVTLPYTLNAIPVSSGGNITIDGQQYVSDYVDVERGKLVRMCGRETLNTKNGEINEEYRLALDTGVLAKDDGSKKCIFSAFKYVEWETCAVGTMIYIKNIKKPNNEFYTAQELKELSLDFEVVYQLAEKQETDLPTEQITAFKALATYYPTTNISVNSEQLDGYTVFNYPISMANGWNYVKQQLNDNRDYIYDIDTQSAEAYVNSEYAVALTELEV